MSSSKWETATLGNVAEIIMGQSPAGETCNEIGNGVPLLNGPTEFGNFHPKPVQYTTDPKKFSKAGDILFCVRGSTTGRMNWADKEYAIGRGLAAIRHKNGKEFQPFLKGIIDYYLPYLLTEATGSTFPNVSSQQLNSLVIEVPPLPTQRRIADILSALDEKIELNRQTNATLEAIAQSIFREWFVDNEDAVNWEIAPLPEVINLNVTRTLKKGSIAPYLDMANMPTQGHRAIEWRDRPFGSGTKFVNGDTLLARITPCLENGKTAFVDFLEDGQVGWGSTEYIVFSPKPPLPPEYGYYLARTEEVRNHAIQNMIGTSGRQRASASCFDSFMISIPPAELAAQFGEVAGSLMTEIKANDEESRTLASIRDILLPKLMSGEIEC